GLAILGPDLEPVASQGEPMPDDVLGGLAVLLRLSRSPDALQVLRDELDRLREGRSEPGRENHHSPHHPPQPMHLVLLISAPRFPRTRRQHACHAMVRSLALRRRPRQGSDRSSQTWPAASNGVAVIGMTPLSSVVMSRSSQRRGIAL